MNGKGKIPKNRFQAIAKKYPLYLAIAGVAVSFIFSLENYAFEKGMVNFNVMDTYIYADMIYLVYFVSCTEIQGYGKHSSFVRTQDLR